MSSQSFNRLNSKLRWDNSFARLGEDFSSKVLPQPLRQCALIHSNARVAQLLGLDTTDLSSEAFAGAFSGQELLPGMAPRAMVYSGHQFGVYNPQLGDGRGLLLGELQHNQQRWDIHLKGSGKTPYSRFADGRAVLRSSIREYLGSEALAGLGIATTRALALFGSEEPVARETLESGALLVRVAETHIRFGHFEYFHYTGQPDRVRRLAEYLIERHFPQWQKQQDRHEQLLHHIVDRTAELIAAWQSVGFTHGVMNTDNMSILGDTFDYGPYGFLDNYQAEFVCNHSDEQGRYAFNQQPVIGLWNLNALAHALSSLLEETQLKNALQQYQPKLIEYYNRRMRNKLGLALEQSEDITLLQDWLDLLENNNADFSNSFRALCDFDQNQRDSHQHPLRDAFIDRSSFDRWAERYSARLKREHRPQAQRQQDMKRCNPKFILRNYLMQRAIDAAQEQQDYSQIDTLFKLCQEPFAEYDDHPEWAEFFKPPPQEQQGMALSCSS